MGLLGTGVSLLQSLKSRKASKEVPAMTEMLQAIRNSQEYGKAAGDPSHPFFKNVLAVNAENNLADLSASLRELMVQDRRARAMGTTGALINPERRDEAMASSFARNLYGMNEEAKKKAQQYLMATAQGYAQSAGQFAPAMQVQAEYGQMDANRRGYLGPMLGAFGQQIVDPERYRKESQQTAQMDLLKLIMGGGLQPKEPPPNDIGFGSRFPTNYRRTFGH